ncbi:hypothetical protein SAMN05421824_3009 [Hyunsoonleella jejuensis]|uniref:Uncharacterized protein n=1 Tax=Hyunsoonleella jejuensis TaxID=419940 RepID=A0A1H9LDW2_9FLAO|nr:hypothetical protein SAMN05421824_3009 [Hyunsoonleella jejuensis]
MKIKLLLHFFPRHQVESKIFNNYQKLTGKIPTTLPEFIDREKERLTTH